MSVHRFPVTVSDADVLAVLATHPNFGDLRYERAHQDGRVYYRLLGRRTPDRPWSGGGALTTLAHARATVAYWREKGWTA